MIWSDACLHMKIILQNMLNKILKFTDLIWNIQKLIKQSFSSFFLMLLIWLVCWFLKSYSENMILIFLIRKAVSIWIRLSLRMLRIDLTNQKSWITIHSLFLMISNTMQERLRNCCTRKTSFSIEVNREIQKISR